MIITVYKVTSSEPGNAQLRATHVWVGGYNEWYSSLHLPANTQLSDKVLIMHFLV